MRVRRLSSLLGGAMLAPSFVIFPLDFSAAAPAPTPISGTESTADMVDSASVEVADAAHAPEDEIRNATSHNSRENLGAKTLPDRDVKVQKATTPQDVNPTLAAVGITWDKGTSDGAQSQYRVYEDGRWGAWNNAEFHPSVGPDPSKVPGVTREGSDLILITGATKVQARVLGGPGQVPANPKVTVIDPGRSDADATPGTTPAGSAQAAAQRPQVLTRAQWGADESWRKGTPESNKVQGIVIHHTADSNNYTSDQVPAMMRGMYRYATQTLGWDDIAYNFIIDRWGRIWQGRAWLHPDQPVWPAATLSNNDRTMGISLLGNYESEPFSSAAKGSLERLIAWEAQLFRVNPLGSTQMFNNKTNRYETMPAINGHRDTYFTACPGANVYPALPSMRTNVSRLMAAGGNSASGSTGASAPYRLLDRDIDGMNDSDILGRDSSGRLTLASPTGKGQMTQMEAYGGGGWDAFDVVTIGGDWNGDGRPDVIARKVTTGELFHYPSNSSGKLGSAVRIGVNWNGMQAIVAPGDWNGDGIPDVIGTTRGTGDMYFYAGNGKGGFAADGRKIGHGWSGIKSIAAIGDWNGDGKLDVAAVTFSGLGVVYIGDGKGAFTTQFTQSGSWNSYTTLTGVANAYGDKRNNLLAVDDNGTVHLGSRAGDSSTTWRKVNTSYAGYAVYGG